MELCNSIKRLRKAKNLSQEQLAEAMSVSTASVSKWETGQSLPELSTLVKMADFFEISIDAMVGHCLSESRYSPITSEKAQIVDKFVVDDFSKIYGKLAKKPQYYIVFSVGNKKRSFRVSADSVAGYTAVFADKGDYFTISSSVSDQEVFLEYVSNLLSDS